MTSVEFNELLALLENNGLISIKSTKSNKESISCQIAGLHIPADEIKKACMENQMLSRVIENGIIALC